jgi:hypothetical protein
MTRVFSDDFLSYGTVPVGSFPAATNGKWGGYSTGTGDTSGNGEYNMGKTCSISADGVLDIKVWSETVGGVQQSYGAAPWPIIDDNRPTGVIGDFDYGTPSTVQKRANIYYGQIEFAFRCSDTADAWKTAWLLWPDMGGNQFPKYGEIDFPEGEINGSDTIHAFMHRMNATTGGDQDSRDTGVVYADSAHTWHKAKLIWKPNFMEFYLDDVKQGATITSRVPNTPMHWVFQTETQLSGGPPALATVGHMQIDWIVMHQLNGIYSPAVSTTNATIQTTALRTMTNRMGWTSVHSQTRNTTTKNIIGPASHVQNQHLVGFGSNVDPQPGAGAAYQWSFMDSTFGYPTATTGYFSGSPERCLTLCGCPPHMRSPKVAGKWDPQGVKSGTALTSLSDYTPPNSSWFQEYADLCAAAAARYPHIKYFQVWNEMKGWYFVTQYAGSNLVPTGSGLPAGPSGGNRWWMEGYTALFNKIYTAIKAVRPDAVIVGPYCVLNGFSWDQAADWANDAFPDNYQGVWGYGDKKITSLLAYFIRNCTGCDVLCVDYRTMTKDSGSTSYYNPTTLPATPDPTNKWTTNPDNGNHPRLWNQGYPYGAWDQAGQRLVDFMAWLRQLGASGTQYQRAVCDARKIKVCYAEWYAYPTHHEFHTPDPRTGQWYTEATSTHAEECSIWGWQYIACSELDTEYCMGWKPEGSNQGNVTDYYESNPLGLYAQGSAPTNPLKASELAPLCNNIVSRFPPGTVLRKVTLNNLPNVRAMASDNDLMLVSRSSNSVAFQVIDPNLAAPYNVTLNPYEVRFISR